LQVIAYASDDKKGMTRCGVKALGLLDSAELKNEDPYLVAARRAYVSQLMAGTSLKNGPVYGRRTATYLDNMKKMRPDDFHTRFIGAVNLLEMPSFVGGDPKKAQEMLQTLHKKYPDSAAVSISLARAMIKNKQRDEARKVIGQVLQKEPKNRWAQRVLGEM
ncbi:MAG: tetratricopeptide repeat protein, partial [Chitinispirillaceae bacterium]|nr:tetratricopeptide repeat protein [Chitinispirillaceae bacterium]